MIEQLVHHFWARGALTREEAVYLVGHGFAREADLPGFVAPRGHRAVGRRAAPGGDDDRDREEPGDADEQARAAEELEDELVGRNAGSRKVGSRRRSRPGTT